MHFGEELRTERERRGITLDEIAAMSRVSLRHLDALEGERFSELPGGVFNRGIVRSYAQCCGLDADRTIRSFIAAVDASGMKVEQHENDWAELAEAVRRNRQDSHQPRSRKRWLGVLLMITALAALSTAVAVLLVQKHVLHGTVPQPVRHAADRVARGLRELELRVPWRPAHSI